MAKKKLPRGVAKHIRKEKARIRREVLDRPEKERQIKELFNQFKKYYE